MHVLLATPHNRLEPETIRAVFTQTYEGSLTHVFVRHNVEEVPGHNIIKAYQRIREIFLGGKYDVLWIVENDVIPPPDALEKLLSVDADIAYGVYCFRRGKPVVNIMHPHTRESMTNDPRWWKRAFEAEAIVDCGGLGFGCTLIRRYVLERLEFRSEGGGGDADTCMAYDAPKAGFTMKAHLGVVCGHKRPEGVVLWPQATRPFFSKAGLGEVIMQMVRATRGFAVWDEHGVPKVVGEGETATIDFEVAGQLVGAGQAIFVKPEEVTA